MVESMGAQMVDYWALPRAGRWASCSVASRAESMAEQKVDSSAHWTAVRSVQRSADHWAYR